jgi:hypothetical protein
MMKRTEDKITIRRFNEAHKMWVNLHFPSGNKAEGEKIEDDIIQILSNQYIERHVKPSIVGCYHPPDEL